MNHSLTDEMCEELSSWQLDILDPQLAEEQRSDMRAAYDLAIEHVYRTWDRIAGEAERDSTVCWRFSRELQKMRSQQQQQEGNND